MKKRLISIIILIALFPMLLAACQKYTASPPQASAGAAGSPSASVSEETPYALPTDFHSGIKTNFSVLTPYEPMKELYTRLSEGPLPDLKPSEDYGNLLPYVGVTMYGNTGYVAFNMFGLVTEDGVIVTDPVYSSAYQGIYFDYVTYTSAYVPAYDLIKLDDTIDMDNPWDVKRHAVCALDGSWVTDFDYINVFFTGEVIMAMRSYETSDIDIISYSGKLLYNTKTLGCYERLEPHSGYMFMSGYGEGFIAVPLSGGGTVYIDALTGSERYTVYEQGEAFLGGYARVRETVDGPIGYINKDLDLVIRPQYLFADAFSGGRAVVELLDGSYAVINTLGKTLFQSDNPISRWNRDLFSIFEKDNTTSFYDSKFRPIMSEGGQIMPLSDGWLYYPKGDGVVITNGSEKYAISGVKDIGGMSGGLIYYYVSDSTGWSEGVKTLAGEDVVPLSENTSVYLVTSKKTGDVYIVMSTYDVSATSQSFKVLDKDGKTLLSGTGYATYSEPFDLFVVHEELSFGYADTSGNYIFKISLLQSVPD